MDKPLSLDTINELAHLIGEIGEDQANLLLQRMEDEQPVLYRYLCSLGRPPFDEDEFSFVASLGLTLWAVMEQAGRSIAPVTAQDLERAGETIGASWAGRSSLSPQEHRARGMLEITTYPEPWLLTYLVAALLQKDDPPFGEDAKAEAFLRLRIFLDALVASRKPGRRRARSRLHRGPPGRA